MKQRMCRSLNYRLSITELHVVAATLDPSQRNLNAVQEYLFERGMTAVDLLSGAIEQYVGDQETPSTQQNPETTDDDVRYTPSRSHEIQLFRCLSISPDNILTWWEPSVL